MDNFVLSTTDALWATIYRKRKNCVPNPNKWFDKAAFVNQPEWRGYVMKGLESQDHEVKQIFREFVDYVANVSPQWFSN